VPIPASVLISALRNHLGQISRAELADMLNVHPATVGNWLNDTTTPTNPQVERIVKAFSDHVGRQLVQPIFEYKPIHPSRNANSWNFGIPAPDAEALRADLLNRHGIYIFYSSAGTVIYLGKSTSCLFDESKQRLAAKMNRPLRLPRKINGAEVGAVARYMSAYHVSVSAATKNIESFLLRAFANSIYNKNSGEFQ
jgi:transcriptional regulator with XRE-family HTH domain